MMRQLCLSIVIAFVLSAVLCKVLIPVLKRLKFGQQVRDDGPQTHLKKQGTPTMGGVAFIAAILITSLIFVPSNTEILPVVLMTVGFGLIGFADDYIKIVRKHSEGLNPKQKLAAQFIFTAVFCAYMVLWSGCGTTIRIPFTDLQWNMGWLYVPFLFFVVLGTDNGVNFTDGIDGLCSSVTVAVALCFAAMSFKSGYSIEPVCGAVAGALLGFLIFNWHPAKVFMGDTGSLALGAFVASAALMMQNPLIILIVGFIYLIEVISVMLQVAWFKYTKKKYGEGRRLFRMAPLHHHFEKGGWSEVKVVGIFTAVTVVLCLIGYMA